MIEDMVSLDPCNASSHTSLFYRKASASPWTASSNASERWALAMLPCLLILRITADLREKCVLLVRLKSPFIKCRLS